MVLLPANEKSCSKPPSFIKSTIKILHLRSLLKEQLHFDYTYLSRLFSTVEAQTIERFLLAQKIEKIKELLTYDEL